jgi:hypothetical protein
MPGYFQKTLIHANSVPKLKHSSDYNSLQEAFDDLEKGDILIINKDYVLTSTVDIVTTNNNLTGDVLIIGYGAILSPSSNNGPSVLLRLKNNSSTKYISNITICGLRFQNLTDEQDVTALELVDEPLDGYIYHINIENIKIENFKNGIFIKNLFDVKIDNVFITNCKHGIHCNTTTEHKLTGQIKVFGGWLTDNDNHIYLNATEDASFDHIDIFALTVGHSRGDNKSYGIFVNCNVSGINIYGSHFEDLNNAIKLEEGTFVATTTCHGSKFIDIDDFGFDYKLGAANTISLIGNNFHPKTSNHQLLKPPTAPYLQQGFSYISNSKSNVHEIPNMGIVESSDSSSNGKSSIRLVSFDSTSRPNASNVLPGTTIFNTTTNKINISYADQWYNADGSTA